jgi:hypothetical protein
LHFASTAYPSHLPDTEGNQQAIGDELDVAAHELAVHADERDGQRVSQEFLRRVVLIST